MPNDNKVQADRLRRAIRLVWSNIPDEPSQLLTTEMIAHKAAMCSVHSGDVSVDFALRHAEPLADLMFGAPRSIPSSARGARIIRAMRLELERRGIQFPF